MKILVVNADALHLGYLGCYGNEWVETPSLNRLAAEGVVFDFHYAERPGVDQVRPAIVDEAACFVRQAQDAASSAIIEEVAATGCENAVLWLDWPDLTPPWQVPDEILELYFGADVADDASLTPWLDPATEPFDATEGNHLERLQETYAAAVTWFDAQLEMILELLDENGGRDAWLVIVTARGGLALGEHGVIGQHRAWFHEEVVHLPLIVRFPGKAHAGVRVGALTQPADLAFTLREWLQLSPSCNAGHSLLPLVREDIQAIRSHALSALHVGASAECALRTLEWAYLLPLGQPNDDAPRKPQLYVKPDDRWEVNDVSQHHLEVCDEFEKALRKAFE